MLKNDQSYWIIGIGQFGKRAVETLHKKYPGAALTVVDEAQEALDRIDHLPVESVCMEGASYLDLHLTPESKPDWIIPAVPIHLAFEWVRRKLTLSEEIKVEAVPPEIEAMLPNPKRGAEGQLYVSYADFRCPDYCTEPYDLCTWTGKPRKGLLYKRIEEIVYKDYRPIVIQSQQLAGGVGGYRPEALERGLAEVLKARTPVLFATACLCHGVIHAFKRVHP